VVILCTSIIFDFHYNTIYEDMTLSENIASQWLEAFNEHNLDKLLALYDLDAKHFSPKLLVRKPESKGLVVGVNALREWWEDALIRLPNLHYKPVSITGNNERVFMEYIRQVGTEPDMAVAEMLQIENGKIVFSRVYHG
jgi:hypothetical protein